ncbi:hypothetical protein [Massilia sp. METH4]|uniref:hypothetical protein n=1 Tax=Massilia sp. METH4 TaxID=3123041 RepID=UPI0030D44CC7
MSVSDARVLSRDAAMTPVSDTKGHEVTICAPNWFDPRKTYRIANAPERTAALEFPGSDLNFAARILYAEASGSGQLPDKSERDKEKAAILNVKHFRINRRGYPNNAYVAKNFEMVCKAKDQFESFSDTNTKFAGSKEGAAARLSKVECADLEEALEAIRKFFETGPTEEYTFDNFRGYRPGGQGTPIGRSRFWLSKTGKELLKKQP